MGLLALVLWAALLAPVLLHLLWALRNRRLLQLANTIPGPQFLPIIGNFFNILAQDFDFIKMVYAYRERYGHIYRIWFGPKCYIGLSQAKDVETIMSSQKFIHKSRDYAHLHPWLGTGLLTSTGSKWFHRRRIITPTFHFRILDRFMDSFNRNSNLMVENMAKEDGRPAFDVHHYISLCTLDIICECAMGTEVNAQVNATKEIESPYVKAVNSMCWLVYYRGIRPWLLIDFIFSRTSQGRLFNSNLKTLHAMSKNVIKKRKMEYLEDRERAAREVTEGGSDGSSAAAEDGVSSRRARAVPAPRVARTESEVLEAKVDAATGTGLGPDEDNVYGRKKRSAFLDHLLELAESENLSDEDIREEVDTIMFEGHDTTAAALSFAAFSLATNQHVQDKLFDEMQHIFGDSDRDATYQDLADMKYLERVIKETLRLYPSVPLFWRDVREEVTLGSQYPPSGYKVPAGSTVCCNMYMLGRNPDAFEDPELFDPDRFLPERWHGKHPFDYTPFSAGPRNCVGQKFAMLEMKVTLSKLVRNFRLLPPPQRFSLDLAVEVVLKSRSGVMLRVEKRPTRPAPAKPSRTSA
ncbi:Cytochrome P450 4C1 [Frankliniella fusca]|uniref:Cytochrome P450 4C1 n=1 Tax=Frankliniella fusca TaxID=407009 RepID=A0AAE1GRA6_9NEOP|nr:Cytochrome P450 4C1 [Frankliniella fusca]